MSYLPPRSTFCLSVACPGMSFNIPGRIDPKTARDVFDIGTMIIQNWEAIAAGVGGAATALIVGIRRLRRRGD